MKFSHLFVYVFSFILIPIASSNTDQTEWRTPSLNNTVYMQTSEGLVIIELAPFIAPQHNQQFVNLVKEGFYDGLDFYRVIDGFVAQAGDITEQKPSKNNSTLKAEFTQAIEDTDNFLLVQDNDFMAPQTGFLNGFPIGRDRDTKEQWLLHCPGNIAFARNNEADSATTDFYIVIGQATRHLDRNMSSVGKVILGMDRVQKLARAHINQASGVIENEKYRSKIKWVKMAADIPKKQRILVQVQQQNSQAVTDRLASSRKLDNEFFHFKGNGKLDICYYQLKSRILTTQKLQPDTH
jgi:peptidylprolyl isomerase